jgi:hypothetical protein
MRKVTLKVFTLAAAVIAPHLIALDTKAAQVKQIEQLSGEEHFAMKAPTQLCAYKKSGQVLTTARKD